MFKFTPEADPQATLKLMVEINTVNTNICSASSRIPSRWKALVSRETEIASFELEELFGTKLRALLQRRKNRDLFHLYHGLDQLAMDRNKLIACFDHYLAPSRALPPSSAC